MSTDVTFESRMKRKLQQSQVVASANVGEAASQFAAPSNRIAGQGERINFAEEKERSSHCSPGIIRLPFSARTHLDLIGLCVPGIAANPIALQLKNPSSPLPMAARRAGESSI